MEPFGHPASGHFSIVAEDLDATLARLAPLGAAVVDEVVDYQGVQRLCHIRGPEGILIGLAQRRKQRGGREILKER